MKNLLHDWIGFGAAGMVVAALVFFLSPAVEGIIGIERTRLLQVVIVALFALGGLIYFLRFLGVITKRDDDTR